MVTVMLASFLILGGCGPSASGEGQGTALAPPRVPASPNLSTPRRAVRSYLDWTSLAYRMVNSDLASRTAGDWEFIRYDSYIQLMKDKNHGIDQHLTSFAVRSVITKDNTATVAAKEAWRYRYFSIDPPRYTTPEYSATYDATYTVGFYKKKRAWVVDRVDAKPLTPVK